MTEEREEQTYRTVPKYVLNRGTSLLFSLTESTGCSKGNEARRGGHYT